MIYRIIPLLRTPLGVDVFDYQSDESYSIGQLVRVPFRKGTLLGIVLSTTHQTTITKPLKTIQSAYLSSPFPLALLELSQWLSQVTFTSLPSIWKSWLRDLPKKPPMAFMFYQTPAQQGQIQAYWHLEPQEQLRKRASDAIRQSKRVIIITPWKHRAVSYATKLGVPYVDSELASGKAFVLWTQFATGQLPCIVTTRFGVWLAAFADIALLDSPDADEHKQDDQAPRFDARKILLQLTEYAHLTVEAYGLQSPLHSDDPVPTIEVDHEILRIQRKGHSRIPCLQEVAYQELLETDRPITVIHPIKYEQASMRCRDCGWQAMCLRCHEPVSPLLDEALCKRCHAKQSLPIACENCDGHDLGKSLPGIDKLKRLWHERHPDRVIDWRGVTREELDLPFPEHALVLVTDGSLLAMTEDIRRNEQRAITFRRLADAIRSVHGRLLLQSSEQEEQLWEPWLYQDGYHQWRLAEREARLLFHYPPSKRLIKVLIDGDETHAEHWIKKATPHLQSFQMRIQGPYPTTAYAKRRKRQIVHLLPSSTIVTTELLQSLRELLGPGIHIDLDPIAFFR